MEKKLKKSYRIIGIEQNFSKNRPSPSVKIEFNDGDGTGNDEFDSEEEALQHALNSERWSKRVFTILPLYYID